jgi:hypothetical protein
LPDTKVGTFPPALYDEAKKNGWSVISTDLAPLLGRRNAVTIQYRSG